MPPVQAVIARDKSFAAEITKADDGQYDATFVMSDPAPDRAKDTIAPSAYASLVGSRLIALWQHDPNQPIGYWENIRHVGGKLIGSIKFATTQLAQMAKQLINDGVPLAASIRFRGAGTKNAAGGIHFNSLDLLECSIVSIPCNKQAIQIAKSYGFDEAILTVQEQLLSERQKVAITRAAAAVSKFDSLINRNPK